MQLVFASDGSVTLKTKQETVSLVETVSIGDYKIPGAGEYDVTGINAKEPLLGRVFHTSFGWKICSSPI